MYSRLLATPSQSILLFGPRGTGKSTWIRDRFSDTVTYDLLDTGEALRLSKDPRSLYRELATLPSGSWAVIDEVQKVPDLLDEVHRLMETRGLRFVLSGSSARKLHRGGANLLAGRAVTVSMFPLVSAELSFDIDPERALRFGMLPMAVTTDTPQDYLRTYADTYLVQEIQLEALTRNLGAFARFLEIAARQNGQVTNAASIARDAGINRRTVQNHFEILKDTLIGFWLPAWKLKSATKQVRQSKFYFFDAGVARALSGRLAYPPTSEEMGPLAETFVLNEVRAWLGYSRTDYRLHFWRSYDGVEVDVLCETVDGFVAIEIKASSRWESRFNRGLHRVANDLGADRTKCYGVYLGERAALWDDVHVLPLVDFLKRLWAGGVIRIQ
ncbi:MAG: AAA family ATPase [Gammaproteobacteria bacterium]|nr:AAA family ATPase [Gammaproteobacteria bacterium]